MLCSKRRVWRSAKCSIKWFVCTIKTIDTMSSGIKINSIGAVSGTMETRSMQPMYPTKNAATIVPNSAPRSALNGQAKA